MQHFYRGLLAGAAAGAFGGWLKLKCEKIAPPRSDGREAPPSVLIKRGSRILGLGEPSTEMVQRGTMTVHWTFSVIFGGIYGVFSEQVPIVRSGGGAFFGLALWIGAHELALPATGLSPTLPLLPIAEQRSEAFSHVGYGVGVEAVRKILAATIFRCL